MELHRLASVGRGSRARIARPSRWLEAVLPISIVVLVAACAGPTSPAPSDDLGTTPPGEGVPAGASHVGVTMIEALTTPVSGIADRRRVMLDDAASWGAFWAEFHAAIAPPPAPPTIDFASEVVVAATMGQQPTAGYSIELGDVYESDGVLYAVVISRSPPAGCASLPVVTSPAAAIRVPRSGQRIEFVERVEQTDC